MEQIFNSYINDKRLFTSDDKILLAVSSGIDSMVMLHLFLKAGFDVGIAHCNFKLRGAESDEDERFVRAFADKKNIPIYPISFNTENIAKEKGISIQMAARELRYLWFEGIRTSRGYNCVAIAHNQDDVIETFMINILRGTGIRGLTGIKPRRGTIVRPLLFASRMHIAEYAQANKISFREDSSNASLKYLRNKMRHQVIPVFEDLSADFKRTILENIRRFSDTEQIYRSAIENHKKNVLTVKENKVLINIGELKKLEPLNTYLYEFLVPYNFNIETVSEIAASMDGISGKQFFSPTHRLVKDRDYFIITRIDNDEALPFYIDENQLNISSPVKLVITFVKNSPNLIIPASFRTACIDKALIDYPLILRKWKEGDYFMPLGMKHTKKLSDFFVDAKLSIPEKENTWLLYSGNKIVWVVGMRIDDRFKITEKTKDVVMIELH